jgi:glycosyltransferase involved in cell wall biosynthesis
MPPLSICINTQTPLIQFLAPDGGASIPEGAELVTLREGVDYRFSPGGVTRMVYPLVRRLLQDGVLESAHWVALNPHGPRTVQVGELTLHHVTIEPERMAGYGKVKEAIWGRIHEIDRADVPDELFWTDAFAEYTYYNRTTAERIQKLDAEHDFDVFYIHDFQQLPVGHLLGTLKPKVFRWHIPFDDTVIPEKWRSLLATYLGSYDVIVVSAQRYAKSLERFEPKGKVVCLYPYVDPHEYQMPDDVTVSRVAERFGLSPADRVALVVARMDPMKGQDVAIDAFSSVAPEYPTLKLVLVGNGSFSGSGGGLGLSKSAQWRAQLEERVRAAGLEGRVVFAGHVDQADLDALYSRSQFTVLPSLREGFGLVTVESWVHQRPSIVSRRAGIAELVRHGTQGLLFDPQHPEDLAGQMRELLDDASGRLRDKLVRNGRVAAKKCSLDAAARSERELLAGITETEWLAPE